jgi:hypothetical protein
MSRKLRERRRTGHSLRAHVEHVRTVHFTLVVLCFALFASSFLSRAPTVQRALEQLESINRIVHDNWDEEWIDRQVQNWDSSWPDSFIVARTSHLPQTTIPLFHLWSPADTSDYDAPPERIADRQHNDIPYGFGFAKPKTLSDFQRLWNRIGRLPFARLIQTPESGVLLYDRMEPSGEYKKFESIHTLHEFDADSVGNGPDILYGTVMPGNLREWIERESGGRIGQEALRLQDTSRPWVLVAQIGAYPVGLLIIPVRMWIDTIDLQRRFIDSLRVDWVPGSFPTTFPELDVVSTDISDLTFDKVRKILRSELTRSADRVEMFGTRLPAEDLARWGGPVVLVVLLYLLLHLSALVGHIGPGDTAWEAPWIGLYPGRLARAVTAVSCVVFPLAVLGRFVCEQAGPPRGGSFPWTLATSLVGILLAAAVGWQLWGLWRTLPVGKFGTDPSTPPQVLK